MKPAHELARASEDASCRRRTGHTEKRRRFDEAKIDDLNRDEQKVYEENDDARQMDVEVVGMQQKTNVMLQRREEKDQVQGKEDEEKNGCASAVSSLHMHHQTW